MFACLRRPLWSATLVAVSASFLLTPLARADGEWCEDEPALIVDGHFVSITLVPHVSKADAKQIIGADTVLRAPVTSHAQLVQTSGNHDFPDHTYLAAGSPGASSSVEIDALSVVSSARAGVPTDVQIVVTDLSKGTSSRWTVSGATDQPIRYTIRIP